MALNLEGIREALLNDEELEYHLMGMEHGASMLPGPGWYPCRVGEIYPNGDVEIFFPKHRLGCTVLKRNIPIAFRKISGRR